MPSSPKPQDTSGDYYLTPEGFVVFTAAYHLKRGYCCQNGCRHCPYGFKKRRIDLQISQNLTNFAPSYGKSVR